MPKITDNNMILQSACFPNKSISITYVLTYNNVCQELEVCCPCWVTITPNESPEKEEEEEEFFFLGYLNRKCICKMVLRWVVTKKCLLKKKSL